MGFRRGRAAATANGIAGKGDGPAAIPVPLLRQLERRRRIFARLVRTGRLPEEWFIRCTVSSFQLDGMDVREKDVDAAITSAADVRVLRSARLLRLRNHIAVLRRIERMIRLDLPLAAGEVVRWYTMMSSGLSITAIGQSRADRLGWVLRRINSPQLRIASALEEIAATHTHLLADPLFPGFNGVIARLLLQYHLARCQFPPILFDPKRDQAIVQDERKLLMRLVELIGGSWGVEES